ncbi:hypothetical protein FE810_07200 [Thalassotalea litorea]|uniref:Uncharacterized protein n=1 Tax=Thalassotalea litorea TaxID=2020715 RepID=A0A5R9IJH9_9GAMM|nr:hypothetical protein [Thalassotalea litorea]TLU65704.1 hypothetical protein FE810_07200 [Thalassotalea litorea]
MSKSIESIWKEGFVDDNALIAPRINQLYQQKSKNIVDKLIRTIGYNLIGLIIGAMVIFMGLTFVGAPILGVILGIMIFALVVIGKRQVRQLELLDKDDNSYHYLKSFDGWLKGFIATYTAIYRYFYPAVFILCVTRFGFSDIGRSIISGLAKDYPAIPQLFGIPVVFPVGVIIVAFSLAYFAAAIYRLDMNSLYGRQFAKLDELIKDMEAIQE